MNERRKDSRYLCADLVRVEWLQDNDRGTVVRSEEGILEDICGIGGCVQLEHSIDPGSGIVMSIHGEKFVGSVSYCFFREFGYFVGIRFSSETVWSEEKVVPDHLTNLCALATG